MAYLGYQWLCDELQLSTFALVRPARIDAVSRVTETQNTLLIPANVAPTADNVISHVLFALKHEGVNLQILCQTVLHISEEDMFQAVLATPSSRYVRVLGFLWESFNKRLLPEGLKISGPTVDLFDSEKYLTMDGARNSRWKVRFNGLGSLHYCVSVERTAEIERLLSLDILNEANKFLDGLDRHSTDRALSWAYLHETESSYAIEREAPSANKAEAFVSLLKQAHYPRVMDEAYLVELQNSAITNPFDLAVAYRHQQNWLRGPLRGSAGVTYVPPVPDTVDALMEEVLKFANDYCKQMDPIVAASIVSFAFVFVHPFMDGNGRLSRFLFHYALCQSGGLTEGMLLPVSIAMKRNEADYLKTLQSFSVPMRAFWDVRWLHEDEYVFSFKGNSSLYRYWDATACVEFGLNMTVQAFEKDLREETTFLAKFDQVYKRIDSEFDVRGSDLTTLVLSALKNNGKISNRRRKQFKNTVSEEVFDFLEKACVEEQV